MDVPDFSSPLKQKLRNDELCWRVQPQNLWHPAFPARTDLTTDMSSWESGIRQHLSVNSEDSERRDAKADLGVPWKAGGLKSISLVLSDEFAIEKRDDGGAWVSEGAEGAGGAGGARGARGARGAGEVRGGLMMLCDVGTREAKDGGA